MLPELLEASKSQLLDVLLQGAAGNVPSTLVLVNVYRIDRGVCERADSRPDCPVFGLSRFQSKRGTDLFEVPKTARRQKSALQTEAQDLGHLPSLGGHFQLQVLRQLPPELFKAQILFGIGEEILNQRINVV